MNQSIGENSFEKSSLEKCTERWQQESANELWKGSFSSVYSQTGGQNTNQVYENLLRICEEIDSSSPDINRSTANKTEGESNNDEHKATLEDELLEDVFTHNVAFEDIGNSLEDIEIYEDILNVSAMMDNDDCIYNQNFDIMKTNKFLQSDTFNDFLTLPLPESMQRTQAKTPNQYGTSATSIFDRGPIFADDEIDQYIATKNFNINDHFFASGDKPTPRDEDTVDPLRFWHKLNCGKLPDLGPSKPIPSVAETDTSDESKKSTKNVLAIFDFTLPSLSSSASSYALSSPEQKDIEIEPTVSKSLPTQTSSCNVARENLQSNLPVLVAEPELDSGTMKKSAKKKKKRSRRNKKKTLELLQQDLVLSSPSSSESSLVTIPDIKPVKKRKLNADSVRQKSTQVEQPIHLSDVKPPAKNKRKPKSSPELSRNPFSPTLSAGAIYIEQQLGGVISGQKPHKKQPKAESPSIDGCQKHVPKQTETTPRPSSENSNKRKRNGKQDSKTNTTSNNLTPNSDRTRRRSTQDKNRAQNSSSSSPASMPSLKSDSSASSLPARINKNININSKPSQGSAPNVKPAKTKDKPKVRR